MFDQPSKVKVWNTVNIDHKNVSKFSIEKFGLEIPFAQIYPKLHVESEAHRLFVNVPVYNYIHRFFKTPENSWVPAIEKTIITKIKIYRESMTNEKE